jgi:hypothetical protein
VKAKEITDLALVEKLPLFDAYFASDFLSHVLRPISAALYSYKHFNCTSLSTVSTSTDSDYVVSFLFKI